MQSSSNVIKNGHVELQGNVEIETQYVYSCKENREHCHEDEKYHEEAKQSEDATQEMYKTLGENMIKNARQKAQEIISEANNQAKVIKENSYDEGYKLGYDEGYGKAYQDAINKAQGEKARIIGEGEKILNSCRDEYEKYFRQHEKNIIQCIIDMAKQVIHTEIKNTGVISEMIKEELEKISQSKTVIIKANSSYQEDIKNNIERWKLEYVLDNVFFIPMDDMQMDKVIIEKDYGKIKIDVDYAMEKIKNELLK